MIAELLAALLDQGGQDAGSPVSLGDRPAVVSGDDPARYFGWLGERTYRVTSEWRKDGCEILMLGAWEATVWPITEIPEYMADEAAGDVMIVERVLVEGCGTASTQNIGVFRTKGGGLGSVSLMQGVGRTSPRESTSLLPEAFKTAMPSFDTSRCPREEARRTMRIDPVYLPWGEGDGQRWSEVWPVSVCGQVMPVRMDFVRHLDGSLGSTATALDEALLSQQGNDQSATTPSQPSPLEGEGL